MYFINLLQGNIFISLLVNFITLITSLKKEVEKKLSHLILGDYISKISDRSKWLFFHKKNFIRASYYYIWHRVTKNPAPALDMSKTVLGPRRVLGMRDLWTNLYRRRVAVGNHGRRPQRRKTKEELMPSVDKGGKPQKGWWDLFAHRTRKSRNCGPRTHTCGYSPGRHSKLDVFLHEFTQTHWHSNPQTRYGHTFTGVGKNSICSELKTASLKWNKNPSTRGPVLVFSSLSVRRGATL